MAIGEAALARGRLSGERRFFLTMALVVLTATFAGFAPSYYLRFAMAPPHPLEALTPLVFAHGLVFSLWVLLFLFQVGLVSAGDLALHRRMGVVGAVLLAMMVPISVAVGIGGISRPLTAPPGIPPLSWSAIPLLDAPVFSGLILAALLKRRDPQIHKRLMLCAMVDMMRPSLGRLLPMLGLGGPIALIGPLAFLLPLMAWDLATRGRVHPATIWGSVAVCAATIGAMLIWSTPAWLSFAGFLAGL